MKKGIAFFLLTFTILSCESDHELSKSIFVEDRNNPGLPAYSEWGYNTFGAYYDRAEFVSNYVEVPLKVIVNDTATNLLFSGQRGYYNNFAINIALKDVMLLHYADLLPLNDSTLDLSDTDKYAVTVRENEVETPMQIIEGQIKFIRTQNLHVDLQAAEVILSGRFAFTAVINGVPVTVSDGRFDLGVNETNFYSISF